MTVCIAMTSYYAMDGYANKLLYFIGSSFTLVSLFLLVGSLIYA